MQLRPLPIEPNTDDQLQDFQTFISDAEAPNFIKSLGRNTEEAFFACDLGRVVEQVQVWRSLLPRVSPFYAVKCNDDRILLKLLAALGLGFDCASKGEIDMVTSLGVDPQRIIYANPCKQASHVKFANARGVNLTTFDSEGELTKIKRCHPDAMLVLRIATDDSQSVCQLGMKFGAPQAQWKSLLDRAAELELDVVGVSFHVGSGCLDAKAYDIALRNAAIVFKLAEIVGYQFTLLDIGGGFPGFAPCEQMPSAPFPEIANVVNESLDKYFADHADLTVIAEPGRYMAAAAFTLAANVISVKDSPAGSISPADEQESKPDLKHPMCYVNDGVYGSFNCLMFDHAKVAPHPMHSRPGVGLMPFSVWGPSCDGLDKLTDCAMLPTDTTTGDWLLFDNMGAYTSSAASCFNGFPKPKPHYYISPQKLVMATSLIRKPLLVNSLSTCEMSDSDSAESNDLEMELNGVNEQVITCDASITVLPVVSF